jgi:pilus assembly protein Flp/PilA
MKFIQKFFRDESGASAIEYGLIAALIAVAVIAAINSVSTKTSSPAPQTSADGAKL